MAKLCLIVDNDSTDCLSAIDLFSSFDNFLLWFLSSPTALTGAVAATVAFITLGINRKNQRISNSLDFESSYQDKDVVNITRRATLYLHKQNKKSKEANYLNLTILASHSPEKPNRQRTEDLKALTAYLNEWERCANGIYYDSFDSNFLYGVYAGTVTRSFLYALPFIVMRNRFTDQPRLLLKFTRLALDWHVRKQGETFQHVDEDLRDALRLLEKHHRLIYKGHSFLIYNVFKVMYGYDGAFNPDELLKKAHYHLESYMYKHLELTEEQCQDILSKANYLLTMVDKDTIS